MQNKCKQNDSKSEKSKTNVTKTGKITFLDFPGRLQIQKNGKKMTKKWQTNDSGAGKMAIFGFSWV